MTRAYPGVWRLHVQTHKPDPKPDHKQVIHVNTGRVLSCRSSTGLLLLVISCVRLLSTESSLAVTHAHMHILKSAALCLLLSAH